MNKFESAFGPSLVAFIEFQKALGFVENTYISKARSFDTFCKSQYPTDTVLTEEIVINWLSDYVGSVELSCGFIRKYGKYLSCENDANYILPSGYGRCIRARVPYLFTDNELAQFFQAVDAYEECDLFVGYILSTAFRLVYTSGLRPMEFRVLKREDIDTNLGTVFIRKSKRSKERRIVMSDDMLNLMQHYIAVRDLVFPDSEYLFPNNSGEPYSSQWYGTKFRTIFAKSKGLSLTEIPPVRVYDLRHRFASESLMRSIDRGKQPLIFLPFLQSYMGHSELNSTAYYIHLLPEHLVRSSGINVEALKALIPEVLPWEE